MAVTALVLLLVGALAASAQKPLISPGKHASMKYMMDALMKKCQEEGYAVPERSVLTSVFSNSDWPSEDRKPGLSDGPLSALLMCLDSVSPGKNSQSQQPTGDQKKDTMLNSSSLLSIIHQMRNYSAPSVCYVRAFLAPHAWTALTTESKNNLESDEYDTLLQSAKSGLQLLPPTEIELPNTVPRQNLEKMMKMLQTMYAIWPETQRKKVAVWVKQQILENSRNCTTATSGSTERGHICGPSANWFDEALPMMGPYLSYVATTDVTGSAGETICQFFRMGQFQSALSMDTKLKPSLARKLLQMFNECFAGDEYSRNVDKLGVLACYSTTVPDLPPDLLEGYLSQLNQCDNPTVKTVKEKIARSVISDNNGTQLLQKLGCSVTALSVRQISMIPWEAFKELQNNFTVQWTQCQMHALVKKKLGEMKCKNVSHEELMELQSVVGGLPCCVLKHIKAKEVLNDTEALMTISKRMKKAQLKALLQGLGKDVDPSELVRKVNGALLQSIPVSILARANITSLNQVESKKWRLSQACYLARRLSGLKQLDFRRLHSILQCVTCQMIYKAAGGDVQNMVQAVAENPQWLSKTQAGCTARKLFMTLEGQRENYFQTVTEEELGNIPATLFIHLPPFQLKDLPDSVCPTFLRMIQQANFSLLPPRAPSRPALIHRALLCLKTNVSTLTTDGVSMLGPLLCDLQPSQLRLMAPAVLNSSLMAMASCQHIPQRHRAELVQLLYENFGNPVDWSAETMEELGSLLLLNDSAITSLTNKPWMKDFLYFLKSNSAQKSKALAKKIFLVVTNKTAISGRKKRAADSEGNTDHQLVPTAQLIEELELNNVYWTPEQLDQMPNGTFVTMLEVLGNVPDFSADQLAVLGKKATEFFGPAADMNETVVMQMGCISKALPFPDLEKLPFLLETLEGIGHCGWNESQVGWVWKAVAKYNNLTAKQLGAAEMVALNGFICGLNSSEIGELEPSAFMEAIDAMDGLQCSVWVLRRLKVLAVSALNAPSSWTEDQVSDLGNLIAGLDAAELASLNPSAFSFIRESCVPLIPPSNFASLSPAQLEAFGPDNAELVTSLQRAALGDEQLAALERASTGSYEQPKSTDDTSGAPSLSIEGVSALMKPLLFLLTGFVLL